MSLVQGVYVAFIQYSLSLIRMNDLVLDRRWPGRFSGIFDGWLVADRLFAAPLPIVSEYLIVIRLDNGFVEN